MLLIIKVFFASILFTQHPSVQVDSAPTLRILTWNIKMLPRALAHLKHYPIKRAKHIPAQLLADSVDVVCFQEAFDPKARRIIRKKLKQDFPYMAGPANNWKPSFKVNSGVMMFSKYPMRQLGQTKFSTCDKEDCMARKGGLLCEVRKNNRTYQLLGTHCEAGGTREMKISQFYELKNLADQHYSDTVVQFFCGDFNCKKNDTILYPKLVEAIDAEDGEITGEWQCTTDHRYCDMNDMKPNGKQNVIDFVFVRKKQNHQYTSQRYVRKYTQLWDKKHKDLSDHYAIYMVYTGK